MYVNESKIWNWSNHKKLVFSRIKKCAYLSVPISGGTNKQNNETYDPQITNSEINITITIITELMIMHCSINIDK